MTPLPCDLSAVVQRLENLERQNRRLRWALAAVVVAAAALVLWGTAPRGQAEPKPEQRGPDEFVLRNGQGDPRVRVSMDKDRDAANVVFSDAKNRPRATMTLGPDGTMLRFLDADGKLRSGLSVEADGVAIVAAGSDGRLLTGTTALKNDAGLLVPPTTREAPRPPKP